MKTDNIKKCIVGIDFGTTSLSAVVLDINGKKLLKTITCETNAYIKNIDDKIKEQSVEILSELFYKVLAEIDSIPDIEILSYGFTGQMHGIVGLNAEGKIITNLVTWQDKSGDIILEDGKTILDRINSKAESPTISNGYGIVTLYKWLHLERQNDIQSFCTIADYFAMKLSNIKEIKMSPTMAHSIGLFNLKENSWDENAIIKLGLNNIQFPEIVSNSTTIGFRETDNGKIPVICAIGDNQASFIGSIADKEKSILLNVGTGTQLSFQIKKEDYPVFSKYIDDRETQLRPLDQESYLVATSYLNGGSVYKSLFNFFKNVAESLFDLQEVDEDELWKNMEKAGWNMLDHKDQLEVSPLLAGQRKITSNDKGSIKNITTDNFSSGYLVLAFLKGLADYYKTGYFPELENRISHLVGSGNGLKKNKLLVKCIEDSFGYPLALTSYNEEAAVGAALNSGYALKLIDNNFFEKLAK